MKKVRDYLNKDIKEFNVKLLIILGILFLFVVGIISYKTTNSSYALFSNNVTGSKVITVHYEDQLDKFIDTLKSNATKTTIDFSEAPSNTNGNGLNILDGTENDDNPIYFYRGFGDVVDHNNVLFGGFCWKIVRTTSTGGIKLAYNGVPTNDNKCNGGIYADGGRATSDVDISMSSSAVYYYGTSYTFDPETGNYSLSGTITSGIWDSSFAGKYTCKKTNSTDSCSPLYYIDHYVASTIARGYLYSKTLSSFIVPDTVYNSEKDSPAYNGYMYGDVYHIVKETPNSGSIFGQSFTYSGGQYTLTNTQSTADNTHHYTCNNSTGQCNTVRYYYYYASNVKYYVELTGGDGIQQALSKMQTNTTDSTIKQVIDSWYEENLIDYEDYLEDTTWCNDRSATSLNNGWNESGGLTELMYYKPYETNTTTYIPSVLCQNKNDAFTVNDTTNGNGALDYPIALLTADELTMAGNGSSGYSKNSYLYLPKSWWVLSPRFFYSYEAHGFSVDQSQGYLGNVSITNSLGVRPSIALKSNAKIASGNGSENDPYVVKMNNN